MDTQHLSSAMANASLTHSDTLCRGTQLHVRLRGFLRDYHTTLADNNLAGDVEWLAEELEYCQKEGNNFSCGQIDEQAKSSLITLCAKLELAVEEQQRVQEESPQTNPLSDTRILLLAEAHKCASAILRQLDGQMQLSSAALAGQMPHKTPSSALPQG